MRQHNDETLVPTTDTDARLAAYYCWDPDQPDLSENGVQHWYAQATNFVVETLRGSPGSSVQVLGNPDEVVIVLTELSAAIRVITSDDEVDATSGAVVIVPPGDHTLQFGSAGYVHRIFTSHTPTYARTRHLARQTSPAAAVAPLRPGSAPRDGYRLRHYDFADYPVNRPKRVFRSANIMVAVLGPVATPRGRLSPHFHDDFEQASLVTQGDYIHHVRRQWGPDRAQWRDDEHHLVGAPSVTVISPPDVHTSETVGNGPFEHVDVFCPPREDFIASGQVLNPGDYPWPPDSE